MYMTSQNNSNPSVGCNSTLFNPFNRNELISPFEQVLDSFINEFSGMSPANLKAKTGYPKWDIYSTDEDWIVELAVTGCGPEDVTVEILPTDTQTLANTLTNKCRGYKRMLKVSGRVSEDLQHKEASKYAYLVRELRRSSFERFVYLPNEIEGDPEATMSKGILKLAWKLPEKAKKAIPKKIQIKSD